MATDGENRTWLIGQFEYMFGRKPTLKELEFQAKTLKTRTRSWWVSHHEKVMADQAVIRLWEEKVGRKPTAHEIKTWGNKLRAGTMTRKKLAEFLAGTSEAQLRKPEEAPNPDKENAKTLIKGTLERLGLGGMDDWVLEQIENDYSEERVLDNLRQTEQHKARFGPAMNARKAAGLPFIDEGTIIGYEDSMRQMMRASGMPADYYDQPSDFADWIGKDISPAEQAARIGDAYVAMANGDAETRAQAQELYGLGVTPGEIAAWIMDASTALPIIQRRLAASQISGAGVRSGYGGLDVGEAERLASLGVTQEEAGQGFGALTENRELFGALPGEQDGLIDRETQMEAVFGDNALARETIERKAGARRSAGSGAQSFGMGQSGAGGLSRR